MYQIAFKLGAIIILALYLSLVHAIDKDQKAKTVVVVLLVRNKEFCLPYFLTLFENLDYPKNRLSLYIRSDHNNDRSIEILKKWLPIHEKKYHSVDIILDVNSPKYYSDERSPANWTLNRFDNFIKIKSGAFDKARRMWANYIWFVDIDTFLMNPFILHDLIDKEKSIVAPMLNSLGTYSNFWCGMTEQYWYMRTDEYLPILGRKNSGCFSVPMVHSCVLIDLSKSASDKLSFNPEDIIEYDGPTDDIIAFAISAEIAGLEMHICNDIGYGFIPSPLQAHDSVSKEIQLLSDLKLEILVLHPPLEVSPLLKKYVSPLPIKDKLGFDHIYLINLARRPDRRERMLNTLDELGLEASYFEAVDGTKLNETHLNNLGVKQLNEYKDPWANRDMTYGEIGCFLSHYYIWEDIIENGYSKVIVFEDDIRFEAFFRDKVKYLMNEMELLGLPWDLVYFGRKKLKHTDEPAVDGSEMLVHVAYSYWTLCYIVTLEGAKKLVRSQPLAKMVPVDEYIPIMFNRHPEIEWMEHYPIRNLVAYSVDPLLVYPTHYTGDEGYFSDTEASSLITEVEGSSLGPSESTSGMNVAISHGKDEL